MKQLKLFFSGLLFVFFLFSCSEPTLEEEAKNAAFLMKTSMEFSAVNELKTAEKNYLEAEKIIEKYRNTDRFMEFYDKYNTYLQEMTESENYETLFK